jgi:heptosyltransferase-2
LGALYPPTELGPAAALPAGLHVPSSRYRIVIAPVSNSAVRDWPVDYYITLIKKLVGRFDCTVLLIGSRPQSSTLAHIVQATEAGGHRVLNLAGRLAWPEVPALLHTADLVICNNSGIAHLSASLGTRTLSIYSASHQPQEWGPRGAHSKSMMAILPCSPCGHEQLADCPFEHGCMTGLSPDSVFEQAADWLQEI